MRGPEHYVEAERLAEAYKDAITTAEALPSENPRDAEERYVACANARSLLEKAQVHATLALTAATVVASAGPDFTGTPAMRGEELDRELSVWAAVITAPREAPPVDVLLDRLATNLGVPL